MWKISFVHAPEVSKRKKKKNEKKKLPDLRLVFQVGAREPIKRIRVDHHWFCLDVLWSPDCQSAAVLLLARQRATGSHGWLKTNTPLLRDSSSSVSDRT